MGMNFSNEGYDGSKFGDFYVARDGAAGPGWFIFGRDAHKYGRDAAGKGNYVKLCGYVREGGARNYNGRVRQGWRLKRDALAALAAHLASYPHLNAEGQ
jgi:hypothetical protein